MFTRDPKQKYPYCLFVGTPILTLALAQDRIIGIDKGRSNRALGCQGRPKKPSIFSKKHKV